MAFKKSGIETLSYVSGNVVDDKADVLVNTVNCQLSRYGNGVMGKGVALAFKERYPTIMPQYEAAIRSGELKPGRTLLFDLPDGRKWAAMGTKDHFRDNSMYQWVDSGLRELGEKMREAGLKSVALPPPGCGNGKLAWDRVEPMVHQHLQGLQVSMYAKPSGAMVNSAALEAEMPRLEALGLTAARDRRIKKHLYGELVSRPDCRFEGLGAGMRLAVHMQVREQEGRRPVPVLLKTDPLLPGTEHDIAQEFVFLEPGSRVSVAGRWEKAGEGWSFAAERIAKGDVPPSGLMSDIPSPAIVGDQSLATVLDHRRPDKGGRAAPDGRSQSAGPKPLEATMYFAYGRDARPGFTPKSTFEAILEGQRTSTTRFKAWGGMERWEQLKQGDEVRFFADKDKSGPSVLVKVAGVRRVDLKSMSEPEIEAWSQAEGWSKEHGRKIGARGEAVQIRYVPVPGQAILAGHPTARAEFLENLTAKVDEQVKAAPNQVRPSPVANRMTMLSALGEGMSR